MKLNLEQGKKDSQVISKNLYELIETLSPAYLALMGFLSVAGKVHLNHSMLITKYSVVMAGVAVAFKALHLSYKVMAEK